MITPTQAVERLDDPSTLIRLCHHRWGIPILAELQRSAGGAKFIALQSKLGLSRDALSRTLAAMQDLDLVLRNPGYGHPMRPEFLLTPFGEDAGPACLKLWNAVDNQSLQGVAGRKWSLPTVWALGEREVRFSSVQQRLPEITPRALTAALRELEEATLIVRTVIDGRPPGVRYSLTDIGNDIAGVVDDLARALEFGR